MDQAYKKQLQKQGYLFVGEHTSVKVCGWTKKKITGCGSCYKNKFYGINSSQCIQMTPATNFCDHDCTFCWRSRNNSPFGIPDDPKEIVPKSVDAHNKLLNGFPGNEKTIKAVYEESQKPRHVAISLNGEPTYYPRMSELIREYHKQGFSTFVVSNGQLPEVLTKMEAPTQLYLSLDAPNEQLYKEIDRPMRKDGWQRLMKSLEVLKDRKNDMRTAVRITLLKGKNDSFYKEYADLLDKADPHFVEVKSYMFIGASRQRLSLADSPLHEEIVAFCEKLASMSDWKIIDDQPASRVVLMMKKDFEGRIMDFSQPMTAKVEGDQTMESEEVEKATSFVDENSDEVVPEQQINHTKEGMEIIVG